MDTNTNEDSDWSDVPDTEEAEVKKDIGSCKTSKIIPRKRTISKRHRQTLLPAFLKQGDCNNFEKSLSKTAKLKKWNRIQVKTLIKHVIKTPGILNYVLKKSGDLPNSVIDEIEPKWTREKAKKMGDKVPWVLQKIAESEDHLNKNTEDDDVPLISAQLPDDEEDDDVEYDPSKDPMIQKEMYSEPDSFADTNSNMSEIKTKSDPLADLRVVVPEPINNTMDIDNSTMDDGHFRLTRSSGALKDIQIEDLEVQFVPPDITPDMYDLENIVGGNENCYTSFLRETFYNRSTTESNEVINIVENKDPENIDELDPDFMCEDLLKSEEEDEFKFDKTTVIPREEVDGLINEIIHVYDLDATKNIPSEYGRIRKRRAHDELNKNLLKTFYEEVRQTVPEIPSFSNHQINIINHQIASHVQLLTQVSLLSSKQTSLEMLNNESHKMMSEIFYSTPDFDVNQSLITSSLQFLNRWELSPLCPYTYKTGNKKELTKAISGDLMKEMGETNCFPYPSLLPSEPKNYYNKKPTLWFESEDFIISFGLEKIYLDNQIKKEIQSSEKLSKLFLPCKNYKQIQKRIRNQKVRNPKNPIVYFTKHLQSPNYSITYEPMQPILKYALKNTVSKDMKDPWRIFFRADVCKKPLKRKNISTDQTQFQIEFTYENDCLVIKNDENNFVKEPASVKKKNNLKEPTNNKSLYNERKRILKKYSPLKKKIPSHSKFKPIHVQNNIIDLKTSSTVEETPQIIEVNDFLNVQSFPDTQSNMNISIIQNSVSPIKESPRRRNMALSIIKVAEKSLDKEKYIQFLEIIQRSTENIKCFKELHVLCSGNPDIQECLLDILEPSEVLTMGKVIYEQYVKRNKYKIFLRDLKLNYKNQKNVYNKVLKEICINLDNPNIKMEALIALGGKLFKGNKQLNDSFMALLPKSFPTTKTLPQPETITLNQEGKIPDKFFADHEKMTHENIEFVDDCQCHCHQGSSKKHCIHCSLDFHNGMVFIRDGKLLKQAKVDYPCDASEKKTTTKKRIKKI